MKLFILAIITAAIFSGTCVEPAPEKPVERIHEYVSDHLDSLTNWLTNEFIPLATEATDASQIKRSFLTGRKKYKKIEFAVEYFFGNSSRNLNGPPLPEIEPEEHIVLEPGGFQVLEEYLFPFDTSERKALIRETAKMKSILTRVKTLWDGTSFRDDQVFDAIRLECFRVITLGISGFDTPLSFNGINEIPEALGSVQYVLDCYKTDDKTAVKELQTNISDAITYSRENNDFNDLDRLAFITQYINPITRKLLQLQRDLHIPIITNVYALKGDIETLFDSAAFNLNYFTPDANSYITKDKVDLGRKLFYDPILSGSGTISCSSCHQPEKAFTDGLQKSKALAASGFLPRNTPSLFNAGLQKAQFYDMRSAYLEDQVKNVIENKDEIHGNMDKASNQFTNDKTYLALFQKAFGLSENKILERHIQVALSCYIRSLTSFNSRFDKYMRGDYSQLNEDEKQGFNLFMGKAKCGICHFMPVFNGSVPPVFTFTESEVIGVPEHKDGKRLDPDPGRYAIYKIDNFRNAFKTPTIRNIELTAPYMHNGVYETLAEVIDFYNKGGGAGMGLSVDNQTLPFDSLLLTDVEKNKLISFLKTVTDISGAKQ